MSLIEQNSQYGSFIESVLLIDNIIMLRIVIMIIGITDVFMAICNI